MAFFNYQTKKKKISNLFNNLKQGLKNVSICLQRYVNCTVKISEQDFNKMKRLKTGMTVVYTDADIQLNIWIAFQTILNLKPYSL